MTSMLKEDSISKSMPRESQLRLYTTGHNCKRENPAIQLYQHQTDQIS